MRGWKLLAIGLVTVACLAWALWGMDLAATAAAWRAFDPHLFAPILLASVGLVVSRAARFWFLLRADVRFVDVLAVMQVGFLAINVVPLRMGELVRPYLLSEQYGVPFGTAMAAVVVERLLDMLALLVLLLVVGWTVDVPGGAIAIGGVDLLRAGQRSMALGVLSGITGITALAIAGDRGIGWVTRATEALAPPLARPVTSVATTLVDAFRSLAARPASGLGAVLATGGVWASTLVTCASAMRGFALEPTLDLVLTNWAATITAMALLPTPGFVGPWEAGSVASLAVFGVDGDVARAYSLLNHAAMFSVTASTGLLFLALQGWSLTEVVRASQR